MTATTIETDFKKKSRCYDGRSYEYEVIVMLSASVIEYFTLYRGHTLLVYPYILKMLSYNLTRTQ